jgi:protein AFG1
MRPMAYSTLTRLPNRTGLQSPVPTQQITVPVNSILLQKRGLATAAEGAAAAPAPSEALSETKPSVAPQDGPMREYDVRVEEGRLRDDPYQRGK